MGSIVCTLFEGNYHYGLGALANSLYAHGFRGCIWAGFRGELPPWAQPLVEGDGYVSFQVAAGCEIRFVRVVTERHLTHFKPVFILDLLDRLDPEAETAFYFDPDIVVKCRWSFFEEWAGCGVALCEDINSPMSSSHPIRHQWRAFARRANLPLNRALEVYVNGGFIGLRRNQAGFLALWRGIIDAIEEEKGQLGAMMIEHRPATFYCADQDALNMAIMSEQFELSLIGKEGMDFIPGGYTMSHAAGGAKPWRKRMLASALRGVPPNLADKGYWRHVATPIRLYSPLRRFWQEWALTLGALLGRYVRRA
ncbi:MAG: hypothetical protein QOE70_6457 [Chthoniobacter sp.]|jgi:hypothetical protein|nr:hypothetical protein [Chthoniobacter sp.]